VANAIYPKWKQALLQATANSALNGSGTTGVYAALIDTGVTGYNSAHEFFSSLASALVGTEAEIGATKTYTDGVFDGADVNFGATSGNTAEAVVIFVKNAGANTTWRLVAFLDTGITNLPVTPNGGSISISFDATGIFGL
jgi:hypothetical protein